MVATRESREWANQVSSWSGEGESGEGGTRRSFNGPSRHSQSAMSHMGLGGAHASVSEARRMTMGTWSDPVEGRVVASQDWKAGRMRGFAKARSMALGLKVPERGNLV